jgi:hypothetical protein
LLDYETNRDVELRKVAELPFMPDAGSLLPREHCPGRPLVVQRVFPCDSSRFIVDVVEVCGYFEELAGWLINIGWRPHFEFVFDDEDVSVL